MSVALVADVGAWIVCVLALIQRKARWLFMSAIIYAIQGKGEIRMFHQRGREGGRGSREGSYGREGRRKRGRGGGRGGRGVMGGREGRQEREGRGRGEEEEGGNEGRLGKGGRERRRKKGGSQRWWMNRRIIMFYFGSKMNGEVLTN